MEPMLGRLDVTVALGSSSLSHKLPQDILGPFEPNLEDWDFERSFEGLMNY